jgi:hypothetical protein
MSSDTDDFIFITVSEPSYFALKTRRKRKRMWRKMRMIAWIKRCSGKVD